MKLHLKRALSVFLVLLMLASAFAVPASAAEYRTAVNSASDSYKSGRYYQNYLKVPITGVSREDLLAIALSQLGYQEGSYAGQYSGLVAGGPNYTEYNWSQGDWGLGYGGSDYPWCASFVSWCLYQSRCTDVKSNAYIGRKYNDSPSGKNPKDYMWKEYSCSQWTWVLQSAGYFKYSAYKGGSYVPRSGDLIFFSSNGGASSGHIGIVVYVSGNTVYTVEGNTSSNIPLETDGGGVYFKNYSLSSSYIYGYGAMPYPDNSAPSVDYSGANPTAGLYMTLSYKYLYADAACTTRAKYGDGVYVDIPTCHMFEASGVTADKSAAIVTYDGVSGYVNLKSEDKVIQISDNVSGGGSSSSDYKPVLLTAINNAIAAYHENYIEEDLYHLRNAYELGVATYNNASSTQDDYKAAAESINGLLAKAQTGINPGGVRITGVNAKIQTGDCHIFTPKLANSAIDNGWKATVSNANIAYTLNVVLQWSDAASGWIVKSKSEGNSVNTPDINMSYGEILLACHVDSSVPESVTSYNNLSKCKVGDLVRFYGVTFTDEVHYASVASYCKFVSGGASIVFGKDYQISGNGQTVGSYTANLTDGFAADNFNVLSDWFGFNNREGVETNVVDGIGSITFNLEKTYTITSAKVYLGAYWDWGITSPYELYLEYSTDGVNYQKYGTSFPITGTKEGDCYGYWSELKDISGVNASYLRISAKVCGSWTFLNEIQVFGDVYNGTVHTHSYNAVVTAPTCTERGYTTYSCSCGDSYVSDYVDAKHNAGNWVIEEEAGFGKEGLKCQYCTECGTLVDSEVIPAKVGLAGDINGDGVVKVVDYFMLKQYIFGTLNTSSVTEGYKERADYNGDGKVTATDYMMLKKDILSGKFN